MNTQRVVRVCRLAPCLLLWPVSQAQDTPPAAVNREAAEMNLREGPATFKTKVNLVLVPVVVRDRQGRITGDLKQEDFQLFDKGKPQIISKFSIERPGSAIVRERRTLEGTPLDVEDKAAAAAMPDRFIAYLFDDIHLSFADLAYSRKAVEHHVAESLKPNERAAIYSTSGQTTLQFTDDRNKLNQALQLLRPRPVARSFGSQCPNMDYYVADLIQNKNDSLALAALTQETMACDNSDRRTAELTVAMTARREIASGDQETRVALATLRDALRSLSAMPGQRTLVLVSPGFYAPTNQQEKTEIIDRAIRANIIVSALDARGLYTVDALGDIANRSSVTAQSAGLRSQYASASASADADVLAEIAHGTGGSFFQNSNDLNGGIDRIAAAPDYVYVLGFSPQNLKLDGSFHSLKVTLKNRKGTELQARRGYYAPKRLLDPGETAKQEIEEALFSREEMNDIGIELHNQFFKTGDFKAKVSVVARVDVSHLPFRKVDGRNRDDLTVVAALFDGNGNYVTGNQKVVEMRLLDRTLENKQRAALTLRSNFDVSSGRYMVRVVVRDSEGQMMAAQNGAVDIP